MIEKQTNKQIMIYLCECILQMRLQVDKKQIKCFNDFIMNLPKIKDEAGRATLQFLFQQLNLKERQQARQKIRSVEGQCKVVISFLLQPINQNYKFHVQTWILTLHELFNYVHHFDQTFLTAAAILEQLLFLLTSQPLYTEYIRDSKMKKQYQIYYNFLTKQQIHLQQLKKQQVSTNFFYFPQKYYRQRICNSFTLEIQCHSIKSFYDLDLTKVKLVRLHHKEKKNQVKLKSKLSFKQKTVKNISQFNEGDALERKLSLYEMYDDDLECTLLSSSESSFTSSPIGSVKQIKFLPKDLIAEEQFQILQYTPDEQFLQKTKYLFKELTQLERGKAKGSN